MNKKTILDLLKYWADVTPNKKAYVFLNNDKEDNCVTFKEVYEGASKYAQYLRRKGLHKGDRVIIFAEQTVNTIYALYGTLMAGGIFILVLAPADEGKYQRLLYTLKSSEAKYIVCSEDHIKFIRKDINISIINGTDYNCENGYIQFESEPEDIACLQYTSGSINEPKGIMWTHKNIISSMETLQKYTFKDDIFVTWLPFFHSMGLCTGVLLNMYVNNTNVILDTEAFLNDPIEWLRKISQYKSTMVWAPNSAYLTCINLLKDNKDVSLDLSSIRYMINCSESIPPSDWDDIASAFYKYGMDQNALCAVYGLSESTGEVSGGRVYNLDLDEAKLQENIIEPAQYNSKKVKVLSGVGEIVDSVKVCIVNPKTLTQSRKNEVGEIWVQGEKVAYGYWNNSKATEETFEATLPGYEGTFLRTGDLGAIVNGQLYIMGRMKEMFIINGHNIFPRDIEINVKKHIKQLKSSIVYAFSVAIKNKENVVIVIEGAFKREEYKIICEKTRKIIYKYFDIEPYDVLLKLLRKNLNVSKDRILYIGDKYGYTGTCAPFFVLYEAIKQHKVKRGDYILFWTMAAAGYHIFTLIKY